MKKHGKLRDNTCWRFLCCICYSVIAAEKGERSPSPSHIPKLYSTKEEPVLSETQTPSHDPPDLPRQRAPPSPPRLLSPPSPPWMLGSFAGAGKNGGPPDITG